MYFKVGLRLMDSFSRFVISLRVKAKPRDSLRPVLEYIYRRYSSTTTYFNRINRGTGNNAFLHSFIIVSSRRFNLPATIRRGKISLIKGSAGFEVVRNDMKRVADGCVASASRRFRRYIHSHSVMAI